LSVEVENQKDKAQHRIEDAFETAKKQMAKAGKEAQASEVKTGESSKEHKPMPAPSALFLTVSGATQDFPGVAAAATKDRDHFLEEAREGLKRIAGFAVNTSACKSDATCEHAMEEQQKSLRGLEASAKAASQHSKEAAQKACKYAGKAGVSEHIAEHARDAAEREAEDLSVEVENQKDKAQHRIEDAFETAKKQMAKAGKEAQASEVKTGESSKEHKSMPVPEQLGSTGASSRKPVIIAIFFMISASALLFFFRSHFRRQSGNLERKLLKTDVEGNLIETEA